MSQYVLSVDAALDLDDIWEYIAADSIDAADRWIAKLYDAFEALGRMPGMGHQRADLTEFPVLFWPVGRYLIIYRQQSPSIAVVAVTKAPAIFRHSYAVGCPEAVLMHHPLNSTTGPTDRKLLLHGNYCEFTDIGMLYKLFLSFLAQRAGSGAECQTGELRFLRCTTGLVRQPAGSLVSVAEFAFARDVTVVHLRNLLGAERFERL